MKTGVVEWEVESRPLPGQPQSGDRCVVMNVFGGVLIAVIDGLGHGAAAAHASECAVNSIRENANSSFSLMLRKCHESLRNTRGVVLSMAFLDQHRTMTWIGVGDVQGRLYRRTSPRAGECESLLLHRGMVGGSEVLPPTFYPRGVSLIRGDLLIMATDGIRRDFDAGFDGATHPKVLAQRIVAEHSKGDDDALVFVGRYLG